MLQKKICLLGDFSVGKTSLIRQFVLSQFDETYLASIGVHITKKELAIDNEKINFIIWDLAGTDGFQSINPSYIQGSAGAIIVGDISREETLGEMKNHYNVFKEVNGDQPIVGAFNKIDLLDTINASALPSTAQEIGLPESINLFKTSAKTGKNVDALFLDLAKNILEKHKQL